MSNMLAHPDLFTTVELTDAVNKLPRIPLRLGHLFEEKGVTTTVAAFDVRKGRLFLVENQDRRETPKYVAGKSGKRGTKFLECAHLPLADVVRPEDIQDVRAFGATTQVTPASVVNDKMQALKDPIEATVEHHRLGAVKGVVMDADGATVLHDMYSFFGISKKTVTMSFPDNVPVKRNPILDTILAAKRHISEKAQSLPISRIEALVGSDFYDALTGHELVREPFETWLANRDNWGNNDYRKTGFTYGGVTWVEASEMVDGKPLVQTNKAHLYPIASGVFKTYFAPANWMSTVNTVGLPYYAQMEPLPKDRGYDLEVQSNPLCVCMYPETLVEMTVA